MLKRILGLLERLPIRNPRFYFEIPRQNFFIGFGWSLESHYRPAVHCGVVQRVEEVEHFREFKLRLSLIVSIVFVCAVPPRYKPLGDPCPSDWPNIRR